MPEYQFHLLPQGATQPLFEAVEAIDDEEARSLAEIRLLLTNGVAGVTIVRSGVEILRLGEDASSVPGPGIPGLSPAASPGGGQSLPEA
jgi:hypothetical protein